MKTLKTLYYHIAGTKTADNTGYELDTNYVKAEVYYSEGGYSCFTYKQIPRAYFISARTVGRGKAGDAGYMESYKLLCGDGAKKMIGEPVTRQSAKKERDAIAFFDENIDSFVSEVFPTLSLEKEA